MKVAIMQPYLFPYIGYFQLINAVDIFVVYDDVNYIKQGWINRNTILVKGNSHPFVMPLKKASSFKKINEIKINTDISKNWKSGFLKTIKQSYSKAPHFKEIYHLVEDMILYDCLELHLYLLYSLKKICNYLDIKSTIKLSSDISSTENLKSTTRVVAICKELNATEYINAIGGQNLYERDFFQKQSLNLQFLKTDSIKYKQFENQFVPCLSIIDVLMFNDPIEIKKMLNNYTTL